MNLGDNEYLGVKQIPCLALIIEIERFSILVNQLLTKNHVEKSRYLPAKGVKCISISFSHFPKLSKCEHIRHRASILAKHVL